MVFFAGLLLSSTLSVQLLSAVAQKAVCPILDKASQLLNATAPQSGEDGITSCTYNSGKSDSPNICQYSSNGTFHNGVITCPDSAADFEFPCLSYDGLGTTDRPDGNPLASSVNNPGLDKGSITYCAYESSITCVYLQRDGSVTADPFTPFPQGVEKCPLTINTAQLNSTGIVCASTDSVGNSLIGASINLAQQFACSYYNSTGKSSYRCIYETTFGALKGSSRGLPDNDCPPYAIGSVRDGPTAHGDIISGNSNKVAAAAAAPDSTTTSGVPKPVIIALLAMNGFLVLAVLLMGGIWIVRRPIGSTKPHAYKKVVLAREVDDD
ncbi:hypothetical protein C8R46DRAFT_1095077 [Mycena filopes]|nr:hypothetical protein C8R46DRAFT_1095077 [Mycena filopes]